MRITFQVVVSVVMVVIVVLGILLALDLRSLRYHHI